MNLNSTILGQTIAFILFVLFCMKYIWPPIMDVINNRQKKIAKGLVDAEQAKQILNAAQLEATDCIKNAKIEAQMIIHHAHEHKKNILDQAKFKAETEYKQIMIKTQTAIDNERKRVTKELHDKLAILIVAGIEKITTQTINENIHNDIINEIINKL